MTHIRLMLTTAAMGVALAGCEALEYKNVSALGWTVWVLVAFSVFGAIAGIARFIWKKFHGQPTGRPVSAQWGSRWWWWLPSWGRWRGGGFGGGFGDGGGDFGGD